MPHPRNPFFTGRDKALEKLHRALVLNSTAALSQPQAISGLGGIGKTQTAIEYAYRYQDEYPHVLWAKADSRETLVSDYVAISTLLKLVGEDLQDQNVAVDAVRKWLESRSDWLLILDNADDLVMAREFMPSTAKGHILLTTRAQATGGIAQRVEIDEMKPEEGALFLLRRTHIISEGGSVEDASAADRTLVKEISRKLGGLPLALDQAGAYIEEVPSSLKEYLELYQEGGTKLLKQRGELAQDHASVTVTFSLAFAQVENRNPAAADLLRVCAFLAPDAIPEEIFIEAAAQLGDRLKTVTKSSLEFVTALKEAGRFSLIKRNPESKTIDIHRLVQEVLKDQMTEAEQRLWAERTVRALNDSFPGVEFSNWPLCERLLPHAQTSAALIEGWALEFPEAARLLNQTGFWLNERARYPEAKPLYQRALAIREKALGPEHPDMATSLNNLALLYNNQGRYADANPSTSGPWRFGRKR